MDGGEEGGEDHPDQVLPLLGGVPPGARVTGQVSGQLDKREREKKKTRLETENVVTHLSSVHLLFLGGKELKNWVGNNGS